MRAARAALSLLLCGGSFARRRHPSERPPPADDFDAARRFLIAINESQTLGPPVAWNATRQLASAKLVDPEAHRVRNLPGLPATWRGRHWAGMIDADDRGGGRLFYWFFERDPPPKPGEKIPVVIWLNGGPGCSSMDGLFLELGPLRLAPGGRAPNYRLERREKSWHRAAHVLFLDQPVGTGFSRSAARQYCKNDQCIVDHFETFLARFSRSFPEQLLASDDTSVPIYFAGESHAGHYVPLMMSKLLYRPTTGIKWQVKGAALGNAWIDPWHQYDATRMARVLGLLNDAEASTILSKERACQAKLGARTYVAKACWDLLDDVVARTKSRPGPRAGLGANQYDARDAVRSSRFFPPDHERVEAYMNVPAVRAALHVDRASQRFRECADPPYDALRHQDGLGVVPTLERLLDGTRKVRLLFYNGQADLICNHVGVERSLAALSWSKRQSFRDARPAPWVRDGRVVGHVRRAGNLQLLAVRDAGHMVPMDQPDVALDMISTFVRNADVGGGAAADEAGGQCAASCAKSRKRRRRGGPGDFSRRGLLV